MDAICIIREDCLSNLRRVLAVLAAGCLLGCCVRTCVSLDLLSMLQFFN